MVGDSPISRFVKRLSGVHLKSPKDGHGHGHHKKNLMEEKLSNTGNSPSNSSGSEREDGPETISVPSSPQVASKFRGEGGCDINFDSKNFQVIRKLGKGNYGKVLLVHSNGSLFALKEQKMKAGFGQEVDLHLRISQEGDHENIVKLYYASSGRGKTGSIALEYCDGVCVDRLINLLSENEIRFITREILRGIEFLHKIKIMHRDIKPENIMITSTGQIKIIDFGMALMMDKETADQAYGSPLYMAPEMITCIDHPAVYNEKTDIWALGISVIEMAVGVLPHANIEKRNHLVKAVVSEEAPSLSKMMSTKFYSKELQDFVAKSLTKNPEERPSASDLLKHSLFDGIDEGAAAASLGQKVFSKKSPPTNNKNR